MPECLSPQANVPVLTPLLPCLKVPQLALYVHFEELPGIVPAPLPPSPEEGFGDKMDVHDATGSDTRLRLKPTPDINCIYLLQRREVSTTDSNLPAEIIPTFVPVAVDLPWSHSLESRGSHVLRLHSAVAGAMCAADSPRSCNFKSGGVYLVTTKLKALEKGLEGGMDVKRQSNLSRPHPDTGKPPIDYVDPSTFDPQTHGWEKVRRNTT